MRDKTMRKFIQKQSGLLAGLVLASSTTLFYAPEAQACTRIFWNTNPVADDCRTQRGLRHRLASHVRRVTTRYKTLGYL